MVTAAGKALHCPLSALSALIRGNAIALPSRHFPCLGRTDMA